MGESTRAFSSFSLRRCRASALLRNCERESAALTSTASPIRETSLDLTSSGRDDPAMSNRSLTAVSLRLACCPPGPPDVSKLSSSSAAGIVYRPMSRSSITNRVRRACSFADNGSIERWKVLVYEFECSTVYPDCDEKLEGETREEVLEKVATHMRGHHGKIELPSEMTKRVLNSVRPDDR